MAAISNIAAELTAAFPGVLSELPEFRGERTLLLSDPEHIGEVCARAKKDFAFDFLVDISSVDNYGEDPRFTIVYELYGLSHHTHLRIKTSVSEESPELPTVTSVWRTADWHEREIYDMMGVRFRGHPDLRRILMWDGYPYFPLRKDFPLAGKTSEMPEIAFSNPAPLDGGPFVTIPGGKDSIAREPRVRVPETDDLKTVSRLERRRDLGALTSRILSRLEKNDEQHGAGTQRWRHSRPRSASAEGHSTRGIGRYPRRQARAEHGPIAPSDARSLATAIGNGW